MTCRILAHKATMVGNNIKLLNAGNFDTWIERVNCTIVAEYTSDQATFFDSNEQYGG